MSEHDVERAELPAYVRDVSVADCDHDDVEVERKEFVDALTDQLRETVIYVCRHCRRTRWTSADERQAGLDHFEGATSA